MSSYLMQPKMNIGSKRICPLPWDRSSGICNNLLNYDKYMWKYVEWVALCWGALISITFELHILRFLVLYLSAQSFQREVFYNIIGGRWVIFGEEMTDERQACGHTLCSLKWILVAREFVHSIGIALQEFAPTYWTMTNTCENLLSGKLCVGVLWFQSHLNCTFWDSSCYICPAQSLQREVFYNIIGGQWVIFGEEIDWETSMSSYLMQPKLNIGSKRNSSTPSIGIALQESAPTYWTMTNTCENLLSGKLCVGVLWFQSHLNCTFWDSSCYVERNTRESTVWSSF